MAKTALHIACCQIPETKLLLSNMRNESSAAEAIAIIGISCRFPMAENPDALWCNLMAGRDAITRVHDQQAEAENDVMPCNVLEYPEMFDAEFFGISPKEAALMDPQQRIFLECAWEALEDGAYDPHTYSGMIGVYADFSLNAHSQHNLAEKCQAGADQKIVSNDKDFMPVRVSYKLNLRGPHITVRSGCSSSLEAIAQAATALLTHQCEMALAGGVSITFLQGCDSFQKNEGMMPADGTCGTLDALTAETVPSNGCGVILLKRLSEAIADGDAIHGIIRGWAVNHDGSDKIGLKTTSMASQAEVIARAHKSAGVHPRKISYIEAHASLHRDSIEIAALTQAFQEAGATLPETCVIGTGKSYIGDLGCAAGVTGVIKTLLQFRHQKIPATLHDSQQHDAIDFSNSPFIAAANDIDWPVKDQARFAGVNEFGVGGTNAHIVLEEPPFAQASDDGKFTHLLILSAHSHAALDTMSRRLADRIEAHEPNLADVSFTLAMGRHAFPVRRYVVCKDTQEAVQKLRAPYTPQSATKHKTAPIFLFPGQGAQSVNMSRRLYDTSDIFKQAVDECALLLRPWLHFDIRSTLYPSAHEIAEAENAIHQTRLTQPCIFAVEYGLAKLWISLGIMPSAVIGYSIGEYVAAVISGAMKLEHSLQLLVKRAELMQALPNGAMLAVRASAESLQLPNNLDLAAIDSREHCTVSGTHEAIADFQLSLNSREIPNHTLQTSHALHSRMMDGMLDGFTEEASMIPCEEPKRPWISSLTGKIITYQTLTGQAYWTRQLRETVRFADALNTAQSAEVISFFIEVGPGQALSTFLLDSTASAHGNLITSLPGLDTEIENLLDQVGFLWSHGITLDWSEFFKNENRKRVHLPTYPFQRKALSSMLAEDAQTIEQPPHLQAKFSHAENECLTETQQVALIALTARYIAKTQQSKNFAAGNFAHHVDSKAPVTFKSMCNEMAYPILSDGSKGSKLIDIDGNSYVDVTLDPGSFIFDQSPDELLDAVEKQWRSSLDLAERVSRFCRTLNDHFQKIRVPIHLSNFSACAAIEHASDLKFVSLLWIYLKEKGIYIWAGKPLQFTTAHTNEDFDHLVCAFSQAVLEMQNAGFLPLHASATDIEAPKQFPRIDQAPTTQAQREIFNTLLLGDEANCAFNESMIISMEGNLDREALQLALLDVITRHPALRSTFSADGMTQYYHPAPKMLEVMTHDYSNFTDQSPSKLLPLNLIKKAECSTPFDLQKGSIVRLHVIHLAGNRHELLFTTHQLVCDEWSFKIVLTDLAKAYNARKAKRLPRLAAAMSFADFARKDKLERDLCNNQHRDDDCLNFDGCGYPTLNLPTDRPRTQIKEYAGGTEYLTLDPDLYSQLKEASPQLGGTLFVSLLSAYAILLHLLTDQNQLLIGVPIAVQLPTGSDELIGHCINILPLRLSPNPESSFRDFTNAVQTKMLDAFDHHDCTWDMDTNQPPVISCLFRFDHINSNQLRIDEIQFEITTNPKQFVNFDLSFNLQQNEDRVVLKCEYSAALYDAKTIRHWLAIYEKIIEVILKNADAKIHHLAHLILPLDPKL